MNEIRFGIVGMGVQGSLYASILTGRQHPGRAMIPKPAYCRLGAICDRATGLPLPGSWGSGGSGTGMR